jgi:hypothetical protein
MGDLGIDGRTIFYKVGCKHADWILLAQDRRL